ncbi:MAG: nuclear transport factor 2 family protein [Luteolibacter sp.]
MKTNLQIIADHYAASARKDVVGMILPTAPDVVWTEMEGFPCAGTWVGADQIMANVFEVLGKEWDDYRFSLEKLIDGGDHIVGVGTYSGTFKRTGKAMEARVTHVWRLAGGKIVAFEQFTDTLLVARAMQD